MSSVHPRMLRARMNRALEEIVDAISFLQDEGEMREKVLCYIPIVK